MSGTPSNGGSTASSPAKAAARAGRRQASLSGISQSLNSIVEFGVSIFGFLTVYVSEIGRQSSIVEIKDRYRQEEDVRLGAVRGDLAEWLNTILPGSDCEGDTLMEVLLNPCK